jgi:hypothetical protein
MAVDTTPIPSTVQDETDSAPGSHRSQPWYVAYRDAVFEADRSRVGERIIRAERMIICRERELFALQNSFGEQRALDSALHSLRALRSCFGVWRS